MPYYIYLLTNNHNTVLYTGVTNNVTKRVFEHRQKLIDGFTKQYNLNKLIYYEQYQDIRDAIKREKQIKGWTRKKKNSLVAEKNGAWKDLFPDLL